MVSCNSKKLVRQPNSSQTSGSAIILKMRRMLDEGNQDYVLFEAGKLLGTLQGSNDSLQQSELYDLLARAHYYDQNIDSAIVNWKQALSLTPQSMQEQLAMFTSNLGSAYMFKGYQRTAISYFFEARTFFDEDTLKNDNAWINFLNIGVCYMELKDYKTAAKYFDKIPFHGRNALDVIVPLNIAKLYALQSKYPEFRKFISIALRNKDHASFYTPILKEVHLEFVTKLGPLEDIQKVYDAYISNYGRLNLAFDCTLWKAGLKLNRPPANQDSLLNLLTKIQKSDYFILVNYYQTLADWYAKKGKFKEAYFAKRKLEECETAFEEEEAKNKLYDYTILSDKNQLLKELQKQRLTYREQEYKLKVRSYILYFLLCIFVLLIFISILIFINQRRKSILNQKRLRIQELELRIAKEATNKLEESLVYKDKKLQSILETVGKIAILKKQLDNFFVDMERIPDIGKDSRTSIKRAKLDFNLFFNNYQDLAVLSNLMMSDSSKILAIKEKYPTLKEQEYRVLLLIIQNYTSKEMAMLLSCTEKNIEYYRTQIRLKLEVPKDHGLKEFIQSELQ